MTTLSSLSLPTPAPAAQPLLFLDTETTSPHPEAAEVLEVSVIDDTGAVLLDTLVRPVRVKRWPAAEQVHGITPAEVRRPELPTLAELTPRLAELLRGREVVIYNAAFDTMVLREAFTLGPPAAVYCAMQTYSQHEEVREWHDYYQDWLWQSLATAAQHVGHAWQGPAHRALADCYATRDVWAWLTCPAARARLEAAHAARRLQRQVDRYLLTQQQAAERAEAAHAHRAGGAVLAALGITLDCPTDLQAKASAAVFCPALTGYELATWQRYGEQQLALPRYHRAHGPAVPKGLLRADTVHLLPGVKLPAPAALYVFAPSEHTPAHQWAAAHPLYSTRRLRRGVHYVPRSMGWEPWPEGCYSKTTLERQFKLKPAALARLRPTWLRCTKRGSQEVEYLLYAYSPPATPTPATAG